MRKKLALGLLSILVAVFVVGGMTSYGVGVAKSASSEVKISILSPEFATEEGLNNYGISQSEVDNFAPVLEQTGLMMSGKSYKPEIVGDEGKKRIDKNLSIAHAVSSVDASDINLANMGLEFWMFIDLKPNQVTKGLTIELTDVDGTNAIKWAFNGEEFRALVTRESLSEFDAKIFGSIVSNTPIGWVKVTLPVATGLQTGELISGERFTFTNLKLNQSDSVGSDVEISFYNISLTTTTLSDNTSEILPYSTISIKASAKVKAGDGKYYKGEKFPKFMSKKEVFNCCYVGRINYLDASQDAKLRVLTDSSIGSNSKQYFAYGAGDFALNASQYTVAYGIYYGNNFVGLLSDVVMVSSYGKGVWLEPLSSKLTIGKEQKIYFDVHEAFSGATIKFESTDESLLKIKEVNLASNYIVVEPLKKGDVGITITVTDDRLEGTDYETTGLINDEFSVEIVKATKKASTTQILLWIALGMIGVGLIVVAIKAIIDARKIEVR